MKKFANANAAFSDGLLLNFTFPVTWTAGPIQVVLGA